MLDFFVHAFSAAQLLPHGTCLLWRPDLLWLHVGSDALIALSYYSIPFALIYFVRRRTDLVYRWVFVLFAAFILACGTTHLFGIWTLWQPVYALEGMTKAITALISLVTAVLLWPLLPKALALPSPQQLAETNQRLREEIEDHRQAVLRLTEEVARRKCIENNLKKSEAKLRAILETALDGIVTIDAEGLIEMLNSTAVRMFGYATAAELLGRKVDLLMPSPYREEHDTYLANYSRTGEKKS